VCSCVCMNGGGKGLVSRRSGMKSEYRAEANGIIHPLPLPLPPYPPTIPRVFGPLLLLRHLIIISYPSLYIYIYMYICICIQVYTVFTIFADSTGAGSINAAVLLTADQRHYYHRRYHYHYYHLSLCPLPPCHVAILLRVYLPSRSSSVHYLNVYISFTQLCIVHKLCFLYIYHAL
jgi:hypothetical protein